MSNEVEIKVDITALAVYLNKVQDLPSISKMEAPMYLRDFIVGQDIAALMLAKAIQADIKAKAKLEQMEAVAYLDRASDYLKSRNIKESSEARKQYVCVDPDVLKAADEKAKTEALVALLKNKLSVLRQCHDDLKKIIYDNNRGTEWEGN